MSMTDASEDGSQSEPTSEKQKIETTPRSDEAQLVHSRSVDGAPPLPNEELPASPTGKDESGNVDDGWAPVWDASAQAYYFFNRYSQKTQWENPRIPEATAVSRLTLLAEESAHGSVVDRSQDSYSSSLSKNGVAGGYNPAVHGDYDPDADYAKEATTQGENDVGPAENVDAAAVAAIYAAAGSFNRYTGKWQAASLTPETFNDENKSRRQLNAYFDVDAAANTHDGRSLKAERAGKKLSKKEVKAFREKRREKKEEKRRAWLRD